MTIIILLSLLLVIGMTILLAIGMTSYVISHRYDIIFQSQQDVRKRHIFSKDCENNHNNKKNILN